MSDPNLVMVKVIYHTGVDLVCWLFHAGPLRKPHHVVDHRGRGSVGEVVVEDS